MKTSVGRNGGTLRRGGGNPQGNGGRPPNEFKARMRALADRATRALEVSKILDDPSDPMYLPAAKWAAEYGHGKPEQAVNVSTPEPLVIRIVKEGQ